MNKSLSASRRELRMDAGVVVVIDELLHAMAQPLTMLQTCCLYVERPELANTSAEHMKELASEVDRVTVIYRCLRDVFSTVANVTEDPLAPLAEILEKLEFVWRKAAERAGAPFTFHSSGASTSSPVHRERVTQALSSLFDVALGAATRADGLRFSFHATASGSVLLFDLEGAGRELSPSARHPLRVAEVLLRGECAEMVYTLRPFRVSITLPAV